MKLYDYAVLYEGKIDKDGEQVEAPKVLARGEHLGDSDQEVQIVAARAIPEEYADKLDRVVIAVRPF